MTQLEAKAEWDRLNVLVHDSPLFAPDEYGQMKLNAVRIQLRDERDRIFNEHKLWELHRAARTDEP